MAKDVDWQTQGSSSSVSCFVRRLGFISFGLNIANNCYLSPKSYLFFFWLQLLCQGTLFRGPIGKVGQFHQPIAHWERDSGSSSMVKVGIPLPLPYGECFFKYLASLSHAAIIERNLFLKRQIHAVFISSIMMHCSVLCSDGIISSISLSAEF